MIFRSGQYAEDCPVGGVQPPHQAKEVIPDLVLVPLLAIDPAGHRLGQGGGHYDRVLPALSAVGAMLIGVGWDLQRLDFLLPTDPWDVALDGFASPAGLEMFR
jgi:5-formyltetrahydrofolate cyclo-ligase